VDTDDNDIAPNNTYIIIWIVGGVLVLGVFTWLFWLSRRKRY
jgi:hypothetical protein